jgi:FMN phosphatase YigB (HAD superfamily)
MDMIKAIIFDWGRTLYDSERQALYPHTEEVLSDLSIKYKLIIVSLASDGNISQRNSLLQDSGIAKYFTAVYFAERDKDSLYRIALQALDLKPQEVAIVDDRVIRGIRWGNQHGATTIWLRQGKFMDEEPDEETGAPTYCISKIEDMCALGLL